MPITAGNTAAIAPLKNASNVNHNNRTFSQVFADKKAAMSSPAIPREVEVRAPLTKVPAIIPPMGPTASTLKKVLNNMVNNHEAALASIKEAMSNNDQSPEKLLNIQFKTGAFFLREQMFCKTAELFTNTLKNFTQMQV